MCEPSASVLSVHPRLVGDGHLTGCLNQASGPRFTFVPGPDRLGGGDQNSTKEKVAGVVLEPVDFRRSTVATIPGCSEASPVHVEEAFTLQT